METKQTARKTSEFIYQSKVQRPLKGWFRKIGYGLLGLILLLIVWQILGMILFNREDLRQFSDFLPIPAFKALFQLFSSPDFWQSAIASLRRVGIGLILAFVFGFSWGILRGLSEKTYNISHLPMQFLRMVSPLSWMPIAIFLLPTFEQAVYFLILMASVWPIMQNTTQGIRDVDPAWVNMTRIQGASNLQLLTKVLLPSALPYVLNGLRLALGIAWIILVPAEYLGINSGLGYLINDARDTLEYDRLMGLVIAIGILGFLLDTVFYLLAKRFDWRQRRK
ncbi:MAG: ABC transporter permease [bacterium]|nr:ABC transporter permease [bacterium]